MSWEKSETHIVFTCDSLECEDGQMFPVQTFPEGWRQAQEAKWVSFKRTGQPWRYFCPGCAEKAAADHAEWNKAERERERIKERNARYAGE